MKVQVLPSVQKCLLFFGGKTKFGKKHKHFFKM